jgi:DNA-binding transcriptional ArsR family regulator
MAEQVRAGCRDPHPDIFTTVKTSVVSAEHDHGPAEACEADRVAEERLDRVRAALPEAAALDLAETFRLLSDPGRLRLISALLEADELCVCDLSDATGLSQTACSHNLRLLRAQRLVRYRKQGRNVYYTLDDDHIRVLLDVARQHVTHG